MTQAYLDGLLALAVSQARALGIPVSKDIDPRVRLNRRAQTRFGRCLREGGGYAVELSEQLARQGAEGAVLRVLAHEVLHTCPGCANHGARWKGYARRMNQAYGLGIRSTDSFEGLGLEDARPVRYYIVCRRCGRRIPRMKRSPLVDHPERYRCRCGGALRVEGAEESGNGGH